MDKVYIIEEGVLDGVPYVKIGGAESFSVFKSFDCGQCFRFDPTEEFADGPVNGAYEVEGVAHGRYVRLREEGGVLTIFGSDAADFDSIWRGYLALDEDYDEIDRLVTTALDEADSAVMLRAAEVSHGIRILHQEPWETLCSFIISQNNNIPRIKKIISALCENFGEKVEGGHAFPTPEALVEAGEERIFALKTGFRAGYIADAARRVASGEIDLAAVAAAETYEEAERELLQIRGVGPKVAACALLFGFGKSEAFPVDTWMKKVAERHFPRGLDHKRFGKHAGIAQQYLFYMERYARGEG